MKLKCLAIALIAALFPVLTFAQSTTVSGQVTDAGAQAWNNGTFTAQFVPNPQFPTISSYTWTGGTLNQTISGTLNSTGGYTVSIPSNSAISAQGSHWQFSFCPQASSPCFSTTTITVAGGTQTVNATPPVIAIQLSNPPGPFTQAYADAEIVSTPLGGQYYNVTLSQLRVCTAVSGNSCTTWGGSGSSSAPVSSLPATCTPGVTGNVVGSVALNGYTTGTEFYCSATNTWSAVVNGINAGVFTLAQQNDPFTFTVNPGLTAGAILNFNGTQTFKLTDGIASVVNIPTSGVTNAFTNGIGAYVWNPNGNATGQFGWVGGVGVFTQSVAAASGARAWGANYGVADLASQSGNFIYGNEFDVQVNNTTTQGTGALFSMRGPAQPTADNFPAVTINAAAAAAHFTSGFRCEPGSLASAGTFSYACANLNPQEIGNAQDSSYIWWSAKAGSTPISSGLRLHQDNLMLWTNTNGQQVALDGGNTATGLVETYGITLKSTGTLASFNLVKIDTANPDSVVICTTVDTICHGFVQDGGSAILCSAGATHCPINTVPGSKVVGVLGTGTCAIGNNVIVDTTTNGRIKCQAGVPAQGAWIGIALSAQASVAGFVDILTKFQ